MNKVVVAHHEQPGTIRSYTIGFGLSIVLTAAAFLLAARHTLHGWNLIYLLAALAVTQLFVQLFFFLHVFSREKPRWNLHVMLFAVGVVVIIVFGSLWIMKNLSYAHHVDSPSAIVKDEGYQP